MIDCVLSAFSFKIRLVLISASAIVNHDATPSLTPSFIPARVIGFRVQQLCKKKIRYCWHSFFYLYDSFPDWLIHFFFVFWKVLASNKTLVDLNLSCNNIGAVSVCLFLLYCSHSICMTVLLSQKHFGKLFPPEETGNLVPRTFPREEGGERRHCLPIA